VANLLIIYEATKGFYERFILTGFFFNMVTQIVYSTYFVSEFIEIWADDFWNYFCIFNKI